jgi:hypothetical protein
MFSTVDVLDTGRSNRVGFVFFDRARKQITGAQTALYYSHPDGRGLRGPYPARSEALSVKPQFESKTSAVDPDAAKAVYVSDVPFRRTGNQTAVALARLDGRLVRSQLVTLQVGHYKQGPPEVGERVPKIHTPTVSEVGGDVAKIDTRVPPAPQLHQVDFADVVGRKPVVITFATPQLCQSRVCGPVVDIVAQLQAKYGKQVAFIHQEIYNDNQIKKGYRPQIRAFRLPNEPWTFVIDKSGRVATRFQSAVSAGELDRAIAKVLPN